MFQPARPDPRRIPWALLALSLPSGWLARLDVAPAMSVTLAVLALCAPALYVLRRPEDGPRATLRGLVLLLVLFWIADLTGLGLVTTGWAVCIGVALVILLARDPGQRSRPDWWLLAAALVVVAAIAWRPLPLNLSSDAPAHVAAILDAAASGSIRPPDTFPGATGHDPRFGILHGVYAILAGWTGASAADTLRWAALVLGPLWLVAHTHLIRGLGMGRRTSVLIALLFTLHAGVGRGFGLAAAGFPGSVSQALCALGLAALLRGRGSWLAVAAIVMSAIVHPFAWWATTIVIGIAAALQAVDRHARVKAVRWANWALASTAAGALVLLPQLLARGTAAGGLHSGPHEVVFVGGGLFVADPFWIFRWGGTGSVLALPALLLLVLLAPGWWRSGPHRIGLAIALPVWLISLNPLVAPLAWPAVSYLVVRLGRIVLTTWVWASLVREGATRTLRGGRPALFGALLAGLGVWALFGEASTAWLHLRQPQVIDAAGVPGHLDEIAAALPTRPDRRLLAAPRIGYGIRARGGPRLLLIPVAHASPNDHDLLPRLAAWRELHDPELGDDGLRDLLARFSGALLLVDARTEWIHAGVRQYGYIPSNERSGALDRRLRGMGIAVVAEGEGWTLFDLPAVTAPAVRATRAVAGSGAFTLGSATVLSAEAQPGGSVPLRLELLAGPEPAVLPRRVFVRLEGDMPPIPGWAGPVSKLWRKLFVERRGRSRQRFGTWIAPADLVVPTTRWPDGRLVQEVAVPVPDWAVDGEYSVQLTVHDWRWHENLDLTDYLRDEDRYTAPPVGTVRIGR